MKKKGIIIGLIIFIALIIAVVVFMLLFNKKKYVVKFIDKGDVIEEVVISGETVKEKSKTSKDFIGWYDDDTDKLFDFSTKILKNYTLRAKYGENYVVTFDTDGGSKIDSVKVLVGKKLTKPKDPTKFAYKFVEWQLDGKKFDFDTKIEKDIKLKAVWKESDEKLKVKFDSNGGSSVGEVEVQINKPVSEPNRPSRKGYNFVEWRLNNKKYDFSQPVVENITLVAAWAEKAKYKVSFQVDGKEVASNTVYSGDSIGNMPSNPSKSGYLFVGWFSGDSQVDGGTVIYGNTTVTARFMSQDRANLNNALNTIRNNHPSMDRGGQNVATALSAPGCTITASNIPSSIERRGSDYTVNVEFEAVCGGEREKTQTAVIIKASPYTYTKTPNSNMLNHNVTIQGGSWNGDAKLFLGNEGSFNVSNRVAVVENGKIQNNPTFKMRFNNDANTIYTVSFGG